MAQPFDLHRLKLSGEPRPVAEARSPVGIFAASPSGVIVWRQSPNSSQSLLQWFDRSGKKLGVVGQVADYSSPELSPDDSKLAVCIRDPQTKTRDIWIFDLVRGGRTRLTFNANNLNPVWSPDGTRIAFTSDRSGQRNIYWKLADGSGPEELLLGGKDGQENVEDWSRDGKYLSYNYTSGHAVLRVLPLAGDRKPIPYLDTGFNTSESRFSPNGQWVAYRSIESGSNQVYVQRFNPDPSQQHGKWQITPMEGQLPRWRSDGKELYYLFGAKYIAVEVMTDGLTFTAGVPKLLFEAPTSTAAGNSIYAVTADGRRFLVLEPSDATLLSAPIDVLVNWR
jgi:dipeptidyl aminopeptidase/acylaminoacyl peptidase